MEHQLFSTSSQNYNNNNNFIIYQKTTTTTTPSLTITTPNPNPHQPPSLSRYESQKRRDWNTFNQYLHNHRPLPIQLTQCNGSNVLEFLKYLDQFGKTKVHIQTCPYFGYPNPPLPCSCPLRQAWGSLDALIGRLRAAYEEHGGKQEMNPFGVRCVRVYLKEVREYQSKARGISYDKKRKRTRRKDGDDQEVVVVEERERERQYLLTLPTITGTVDDVNIV